MTRMQPRLGLRTQLALWYAGIFGAVMLAFSVAVYGFIDRRLHENLERGSHTVVGQIAATMKLEHGRPVASWDDFEGVATDAGTFNNVAAIDVVDEAGDLVASHGLKLHMEVPHRHTDRQITYDGYPLWLHTEPLLIGGEPKGMIRVARPLANLHRTLHDFIVVLATLVPIAMLVAVGGGVWMAGKVMRPIQDSVGRLRRFTADASHELRTPIAIIQAQSDAIMAEPPTDAAELRKALEPVQRACRRMAALVGDLLFLARSDASTIELNPVKLDLDELVEAAVEEYEAMAEDKGLTLSYSGAPLAVQADPMRLHQLVTNLIDNAIKYTDAGGVQVRVETRQNPPEAVVGVVDSGIGIPREDLPRVFDRFYRADTARAAQRPGTGLGLSIARAIVEAHGGTIALASEPGKGTQVTVTLPLGGHA